MRARLIQLAGRLRRHAHDAATPQAPDKNSTRPGQAPDQADTLIQQEEQRRRDEQRQSQQQA